MRLYNISKKNAITPIKEDKYKLEKDIQRLFESNLYELMGLEFVKSEFTVKDRRIDTLAFDPETRSFVIIEYKRDRNASVFDQGVTYLGLMLNHLAEFILEYNESSKGSLSRSLSRSDVDLSQSRVAFVSTDFTSTQVEATNFKDLAIELWQVSRYENDIVAITPIKKTKAAPSIKRITNKDTEVGKVTNVIIVYTEDQHLENRKEETIALYERYKKAIMNLSSDIEIAPQKFYIAFKIENRNICDIQIQSAGLKLTINKKLGFLVDPLEVARDISNVGHWGMGDYQVKISDEKQLEYIMSLARQVV